MSEESELVPGLFFKEPPLAAPRYVVGKLSIGKDTFTAWYREHAMNKDEDWVNMEIRIAKSGKPYVVLDNWKPDSSGGFSPSAGDIDNDVPF